MDEKLQKEELLSTEYQRLNDILEEWHQPSKHQDIDGIIAQIEVLQRFSITNNKIYMLWNHHKSMPSYISENVTCFGYTPCEIYEMSLFQAFKRIYWKQISWLTKIHINAGYFRRITNHTDMNTEVFFCGAKLKDKRGQVKIFFAKQKILEVNNKGAATLSFVEAEEISPVYKGEIGWCRMIDNSFNPPVKRVFFSNSKNGRQMNNELLSNRELDILNLIIANKSSSTIAEQLAISIETVKKHRKNMIAKVGAKDMTALIYFCQQANVI